MNKYSNIMKIPGYTSYAKELVKRIVKKSQDTDYSDKQNICIEENRNDVINNYMEYPKNVIIEPNFSLIDYDKYNKNYLLPITDNIVEDETMKDIYNIMYEEEIKKEEKNYEIFKNKTLKEINITDKYITLTLNIVDFFPKNILDFSMIFCPHCKER